MWLNLCVLGCDSAAYDNSMYPLPYNHNPSSYEMSNTYRDQKASSPASDIGFTPYYLTSTANTQPYPATTAPYPTTNETWGQKYWPQWNIGSKILTTMKHWVKKYGPEYCLLKAKQISLSTGIGINWLITYKIKMHTLTRILFGLITCILNNILFSLSNLHEFS